MPRQFSLKTLLWLMAVVGAFFGGRAMAIREQRAERLKARRVFDREREQLLRENTELARMLKAANAKALTTANDE
jgi:hypothetical protein